MQAEILSQDARPMSEHSTEQHDELNPAQADMQQRIRGLMEQQAVSSLLEATLDYLREYPRSGWGWLVSAPTLIELGRYDDADIALENARRFSAPEAKAGIHYWRCVLYKERGDLKKAERFIEKAIRADAGNGSFRVTLGELLARRGKLKAAARTLKTAIELADTDVEEAHFNLALVRRAQRRYADALTEIQRALAIDPNYAEAHALKQDLDAVLQGGW